MNGQAMIIDGIMLLLICGFASSIVLWGGVAYGGKSVEIFKYMYLSDYESNVQSVLSLIEYDFKNTGIKQSWLDKLGMYMSDEEGTDYDYELLNDKWQGICRQAPVPLLLKVYSEDTDVVKGTGSDEQEAIYFGCEPFFGKVRDTSGSYSYERAPGRCFSQDACDDMFLVTLGGNLVPIGNFDYYATPTEKKKCADFFCSVKVYAYF